MKGAVARQVPLGEPCSVGSPVGRGLLDFRRLSARPTMAMATGSLQAALPLHLPTDGRRVSLTPRVRLDLSTSCQVTSSFHCDDDGWGRLRGTRVLRGPKPSPRRRQAS